MMYFIAYHLVKVYFYLLYRFKVTGRENVPEKKVILCINHTQNVDPLMIAVALKRRQRPHFLAKHQIFKFKAFNWFLTSCGAYPINRDIVDLTAMKKTLKLLKEEKTVMMFPEGTRVSQEEMSQAKAGAGMFAFKSGAHIIPVYISPNKRLFSRVRIVFGAEIPLPELEGKPTNQDYLAFATTVMEQVFALGRDA